MTECEPKHSLLRIWVTNITFPKHECIRMRTKNNCFPLGLFLHGFGRTDTEAETLILWAPDTKNSFDSPDAEKDGRQQEKGTRRVRWLDGITGSMDMNF